MAPAVPLLALLFVVVGCGAPDRAYVEGSRGWGTIDPSEKFGDYETEGYAVTVGVEVPLGVRQERSKELHCPFPHWAPLPPTGAPVQPDDDEIPWDLILTGVAVLGASEGSRLGYGKFKKRAKKVG